MVSIVTKVNGNTVSDTEFNQLPDELENVVTASGQTPAAGTLDQVAKAITDISSNADYYTDSGAADAYVLTAIAPNKSPTSYRVGQKVRFRTVNANTGASVINVATLGSKNIKKQDGSSDPDAGDISTTKENVLAYDGTSFRLIEDINDASTTVKGIVELATDAEVATATDTTRPIVPSALLSLFNASLRSSDGYLRIPCNVGGAFVELIFQWGTQNVNATTAKTFSLPLTFPTAGLTHGCSYNTANTGAGSPCGSSSLTTTQLTLANAQASAFDINWYAIGY